MTMSGRWQGTERPGAGEPIPTLYTAHESYALLWRLAGRPAPARTRAVVEVTNKFIPGPVTVYNTVGEIRGAEKPDEFVVCGAHIDSWDLAQGTTDNGTGTCVVLEAARILAKSGVKPRRTIRFCLFSGEEQGLHGSAEYVKAHKDELPRTSLALVHDTGTGKVVSIGGIESLKPIFDKELLPAVKPLGINEITTRSGFGGGSDHASFNRVGVPGVMLSQDMTEYRFTHHSQSDTLDKARESDLVQGAQVMAITALRVANLPDLLPRVPVSPGGRRGGQ
jgi:Zn-dependent M28 family amino/carboxypeptidase